MYTRVFLGLFITASFSALSHQNDFVASHSSACSNLCVTPGRTAITMLSNLVWKQLTNPVSLIATFL
jgi:hypothetical protein